MLAVNPFHTFTAEDDATWHKLYTHQLPEVEKYATRWYLEGLRKINLEPTRVPDFAQMTHILQKLVGWELVSTPVVYSDGQSWFEALHQHQFLITEYIRDQNSLDYTPLPDIWHDAFGHLPFMAIQRYADYIHRFATHAIRYTPEQRKSLGSLWWYTIEFGLIEEDGQLKALGAGLMSSYTELQRVMHSNVTLMPYSLEAFESISPSPHELHNTLFVMHSWEQVEQSVEDWVQAHPSG